LRRPRGDNKTVEALVKRTFVATLGAMLTSIALGGCGLTPKLEAPQAQAPQAQAQQVQQTQQAGAPQAQAPQAEVQKLDVPANATRSERLAAIGQVVAQQDAARLQALEQELTPLEREWGIKLLGIRLTANGYALHFSYKVLDPQKAAPIVQRKFSPTPYVLVERSGAKLGVPFTDKAGSLRSSVTTPDHIKRGRNYTALFANPGKHVKPGDKVTIAFGNFRAENLIVQ
jgi:hypothetical protein